MGISIIISILGFFGYQGIINLTKSQIEKQLREKLVTPEIEKSVADALEKETELFITKQIEPLNIRMDEIKNDVSNLELLTQSIAPELKKELKSSLQKQTHEFNKNHINPLKLTTKNIKNDLKRLKKLAASIEPLENRVQGLTQNVRDTTQQMKFAQIESKKL